MATVAGNSGYELDSASNIAEDLGRVIFNVTPYKTPFSSGVAHTRATNDNHEWLTDTLGSGTGTYRIEANGSHTASADTRTRKGNYLAILDETATVTKKAEFLDKAGVKGSEMNYQRVKKGKELHMAMETKCLEINAKVQPTNSTAGEIGSVASWINTNESVSATGGTANSASTGSTVPTPGTNEAFSEATFSTLLDGVWDNSGDFGNVCVMGPAATVGSFRSGVSGIADSIDTRGESGEIYNRVLVYQSQFGPIKVMPNKHSLANALYILDMTSWGVAFGGGKMIHETPIATQTSAEQILLECYFTLEARAEEANAGYYAIT